MIISLVVAASTNNCIGKHNKLLWRLPADMRFFKNTTWAMPVIMGRKTFESLGKPLQGRWNIVVTRNRDWHPEGITITHTLEEAISLAAKADYKEAFVIGGGEIYRMAMPLANKIYLTRVDTVLDGDTYFPEMDPKQWNKVSEVSFHADEKHAYNFHFQLWEKFSK